MKQRFVISALLLASVSLGGCKFLKKKAPDEAPTVAAAPASAAPLTLPAAPAPSELAAAAAAVVAAAAPPIDDAAVPAPQDFEDEAFAKVTTANFKAELARLKKEISAVTPAAAR